jgi:methylated-DNA-protein-cysteine methyltransferase-like protein
MNGVFAKVYELTAQIPKGKVTTYGEMARILGMRDSRKIGWALHANKSALVPCHRVVNKEGRLAPNFAFNGAEEQRRRLEAEGVKFVDEMHVDLKICGWQG